MLINLTSFAGEIPKVSPRLLPDTFAQKAINTKLWGGNLVPYRAPAQVAVTLKAGAQVVYKMASGGIDYWLNWSTDVDVARGPINDTKHRIYYTGDSTPKKTDFDLATTGSGDYPIASQPMGVPKPTAALTATPSGSGTGLVESRAYIYTFINNFDGVEEESAPSLASAIISWQSGMTVDLSGFQAAPTGYNVTKQRIYRTVTGSSGTFYLLVAERAVSASNYNDSITTAALGEAVPSLDYDMPPDDMQGIISMPGGFLVAFSGMDLCFSEPFRPHAWPEKYRLTTSWPIVAVAGYGSTIVVTTTGKPYLVEGSAPDSMQMSEPHLNYPCLSKRALVDMGEMGVLYPSTNGLMSVSNLYGAKNITEDMMSLDDWKKLNPASMVAYRYDNRYFFSWKGLDGSEGGKFFETVSGNSFFVSTDYKPTNGWHDIETGKLYLILSNILWEWDAMQSPNLTQDWTSKLFVSPLEINFGVAMVEASFVITPEQVAQAKAAHDAAVAFNTALLTGLGDALGSVNDTPINGMLVNGDLLMTVPSETPPDRATFYLYADGVLKYFRYITDSRPFKLPRGYLGRNWQVRVGGNVTINWVKLAETMQELQT